MDFMEDSQVRPSPVLPTLQSQQDMEAELFGDADDDLPGDAPVPSKVKAEEPSKKKAAAALLEQLNVPERWIKAYASHPVLLDDDGNRRWTDEEITCETSYIYYEHFWFKQSDYASTVSCIKWI